MAEASSRAGRPPQAWRLTGTTGAGVSLSQSLHGSYKKSSLSLILEALPRWTKVTWGLTLTLPGPWESSS